MTGGKNIDYEEATAVGIRVTATSSEGVVTQKNFIIQIEGKNR